jgi:hypothetical protein
MGKNKEKNFHPNDADDRIPGPKDVKEIVPDEVKVGDDNDALKRKISSPAKQVLKQEVVAEAITGKGGGSEVGGAPGMMAMRLGSYSGNEAAFTGQAAETPIRDEATRGRTRHQKKKARVSQSIDDIPSEQIVQAFETVPDLRLDPTAEEGYNGAIPNNNLRIQKVGGAVPASGNFTRSLDIIQRDMVVFGQGQTVVLSGASDHTAVTKTYEPTAAGADDTGYADIASPLLRGNFIPRALKFKVGSDGKLISMEYVVDDVTAVADTHDIANAAAQHHKTNINYIEHVRQELEAKASNEDTKEYNPLSNMVPQPSRTLNLLHDIEADVGNVIYMAHRFANLSLAYQLNKKVKDGINNKRSINELLTDSIGIGLTSVGRTLVDPRTLFADGSDAILAGSPAALISLMDSTTKYTKLSDFFNLPRSFPLYLSQYDQYKSVFQMDPKLKKVVEAHDVFSTIDRDYDPTLPTYLTNAMALTSTRNWADAFKVVNGVRTSSIFKYAIQDVRQQHVTEVSHPLLVGIADYIEEFGHKWYSITNGKEITIPIVYSKGFVSTWPFLVVGALKHIVRARIDAFPEVIKFKEDFGTPLFSDLLPLGEVITTNSSQFTFTDIHTPLQVGRMNKHTAITWQMPELFYPIKEVNNDHLYIAPWYFSEHQVKWNSNGSASFECYSEHMMTNFPESRNGFRFGPLDAVYNFTPQELRLNFDQMLYPVKRTYENKHIFVHKYDQTMSGGVVVRLADNDLTPIGMLSVPRTVGLFAVAPAGYLTPIFKGYSTNTLGVINGVTEGYIEGDSKVYAFMSYVAKMYFNSKAVKTKKGEDAPINADVDLNVARGANFTQEWTNRPSIRLVSDDRLDTGFLLGLAEVFNSNRAIEKGTGSFVPFVQGRVTAGSQEAVSESDSVRIISLQKALWTRINLLDMAISPWDATYGGISAGEDGVKVDPYDFLYYFNFVGFRASDFSEAHDKRIMKQNNLGYGYLEDYYLEKMPILNLG